MKSKLSRLSVCVYIYMYIYVYVQNDVLAGKLQIAAEKTNPPNALQSV